jgi:SAM-dependent methyltransferase
MKAAEFDRFAEEYLADHAKNIRISGESPEYFARYKIEEVRRRWSASGRPEPEAVLDFGTGIGNSLPHLASAFPGARITGIDVSAKSLEIAARRFPQAAALVEYDGGALPFPQASFDLVFSACVFHHIAAEEHETLFARLRELLRPGGWLVIFEHNPLNPLTRAVVDACPFDENAVLIPARTLRARLQASGFGEVEIAYTAFFPRALAALRGLERVLARLPLGAQYYALARR